MQYWQNLLELRFLVVLSVMILWDLSCISKVIELLGEGTDLVAKYKVVWVWLIGATVAAASYRMYK